jgi:hypothetical protein
MSTQSDRDSVANALAMLEVGGLFFAVPAMIAQLLSAPPPQGDGGGVHELASGSGNAATSLDGICVELVKVTKNDLPEVWVGQASEHAADVIVAATEDIDRAVNVFTSARGILDKLADAYNDAHAKYTNAQDPLRKAKAAADGGDDDTARRLGITGGQLLLDSFNTVLHASHDAARDLDKLTSEARAHQLNSGNLSATDKLALGEAAVAHGPHGENLILSETEAERAAQQLDKLNAQDRGRLDDLLKNAKSPQERAYLMKMLAAGHNIDDIAKFDGLIHNHGNDPGWLQYHLTPIVHHEGQHTDVNYYGASWTQGQYPTCVASSTVMARAMVDPSYALMLTTGNKPDDPASAHPNAFLDRLRKEQQSVYDNGRSWWDKFTGSEGMSDDQSIDIANDDIGKYNGQHYEHKDADNPEKRQAVLSDVEHAVDQGKPVPFQVDGPDGAHQMVVIGHQGNMLEIYNPWGDTAWVSEDDWTNGHMDKVDGGVPPNVRGVNMPS